MSNNLIRRSILGFLIGLAVILPGVSGASLAIILGIYDDLIISISNIFKDFKRSCIYLLPIFIFIILGVSIGLILLRGLINLLPFSISLLFIGLIIGSIDSFIDKDYIFNYNSLILIIIGALLPLGIIIYSNLNKFYINVDNYFFTNLLLIFIIGIIVSITQFIPGASASSFLMSIGIFTILLNRISINYLILNPKFIIILAILLLGFIVGLFIVSKAITRIINKLGKSVNNIYIGLSIGSIISILLGEDNINVYIGLMNNRNYLDLIIAIVTLIMGIFLNRILKKYIRKE